MRQLIPLILSACIVCALVPVLQVFARRIGFVDQPSRRKIHAEPIPLMGGVAIYIGCMIAIFVFLPSHPAALAVATGGTVLMLTGLLDDWYKTRGKEFPVWPRLVIYILVSAIPIGFGVQIVGMTNIRMGGMIEFPTWFGWLATMLWVFAITNMINFIDGVDGLASGIVAISAFTLLVIAVLKGEHNHAILAQILLGACAAFLAFNFHPARIFMGDAGAVFIGYMVAVIAMDAATKSAALISTFVPFIALGVPILDTAIVFMRRLIKGQSLHKADKMHTHHTLLKWGLSQRLTVTFLYLIGMIFSLLAIIIVLLNR